MLPVLLTHPGTDKTAGHFRLEPPMDRPLYLARMLFAIILPIIAWETPAAPFRAGAFNADITPRKYPVPMAGSMTPRFATQAHDPLSARCLVLDDGSTKIAFCVIDSVAVT